MSPDRIAEQALIEVSRLQRVELLRQCRWHDILLTAGLDAEEAHDLAFPRLTYLPEHERQAA